MHILIDFIITPGDDQVHHHPMHSQSQNHQHRPPSEHIYFSIESDYSSTMPSAPNIGNEVASSQFTSNTNSIQRPAAQQWRLTGTQKNSATQPYMV